MDISNNNLKEAELQTHPLRVKDHLVSGRYFRLLPVSNHQMLKTDPLPENLEAYYQSEDYVSHTDRRKTLLEKIYHWARVLNLRFKTRLLNSLGTSKGSVLDMGAGTGEFVKAAREMGWQAFGVEPDSGARERAAEKGLSLKSELRQVPLAKTDAITFWHVLEHVPDLDTTIQEIGERLDASGHLLLALPNYKSFDALYYKEFWAGYDVPRHIWHFSRSGVESFFKERGFELVDVHPMKMDAYYVSWLSERYKGHTLAPLRACWVGFLSNWHARRSGEYSSLIYILRKSAIL